MLVNWNTNCVSCLSSNKIMAKGKIFCEESLKLHVAALNYWIALSINRILFCDQP